MTIEHHDGCLGVEDLSLFWYLDGGARLIDKLPHAPSSFVTESPST